MFEDEKNFDKAYETIISENAEKLETAKKKVIFEIIGLLFQTFLVFTIFLFEAYEFTSQEDSAIRHMAIFWVMLVCLLIIGRY